MDKEVWKWVVGWEGRYAVSNLGRVRSAPKRGDGDRRGGAVGGIRKQRPTDDGYFSVSLCRGRERKYPGVHRLVLEAFVGPCPPGMQACHEDGDGWNNHLSNLRWDTPKNNEQDKKRHGTYGRHGTASGPDASFYGRKHTEETLAKMRASMRVAWERRRLKFGPSGHPARKD